MPENITPIEQIISNRREKLIKLKEMGINPYPATYSADKTTKEIQERFLQLQIGEKSQENVSVAGRIISRREMGKAAFVDIVDFTGKLQLYFRSDIVGQESFKIFKDYVDLSDFIGIRGTPFRTKTGELSISVEIWTLLSKTLRPLPEKFHGLKDTETRYRQRYLDLIANSQVKDVFIKRSKIISSLRKELEKKSFLEVETPIMQTIPGGAAARPFITHHNALNMELYLRIAPELYLKRLVVGGLEKVFEIGRNFRNEGIDRDHNPEFTMLELYQAYADYKQMMELCENLITVAAQDIGSDIKKPFKRVGLFDLLKDATGINILEALNKREIGNVAKKMDVDYSEKMSDKKILDHIFDKFVLPSLVDPTFVIDYPAAHSPLAKSKYEKPELAERFELYINGKEIANAYSELNDPEEQRRRFEEQMEERKKGDDEAQLYDEDFLTAIEHGLPPTGGLGIGIDRLIMILTKTESVREVILFPILRPE